jgi:hypothetical protein
MKVWLPIRVSKKTEKSIKPRKLEKKKPNREKKTD